jgi:hypothetical protein
MLHSLDKKMTAKKNAGYLPAPKRNNAAKRVLLLLLWSVLTQLTTAESVSPEGSMFSGNRISLKQNYPE